MMLDAVSLSPGSRWRALMAPASVFLAALAVRLLYLAESLDNPSFFTPIVDAGDYDLLARRLVESGELVPRLFWQPFFYPVYLAGVYLATGGSILAAKVLQAILGAATCCLVFLLGRRLLGFRGGLLAAAIAGLYGPLILFEGELVAAGWAAFWGVLLVLLFLRADAAPGPVAGVTLGAAGALAALNRPSILPFYAAAWLWLLWRHRHPPGRRRAAAALAVGLACFAAVSAPVALLNRRATGDFRLLPASGGLNLYIGNNPASCETLSIRPGEEWGDLVDRPARHGHRGLAAEDRFFRREVLAYAGSEPLSFLRGLGGKALRMLGSRELPRNLDPYLFARWSVLQRLLTWKIGDFGFPFGVVLPLAVLGIVRRRRDLAGPPLLYLVLYPAAVVLVFVTARYRVPWIPVLAVAAAAGLEALVDDLRQRRRRAAAVAAAICLAVALTATLPGPFCEERADLEADFYYCLGHAQSERARPEAAIESYERALAANPGLAPVHYNLGVLRGRLGETGRAEDHYREAIRLDPEHARSRNNLGSLLETGGDPQAAEALFAEAARLDPELAVAQRNLGGVRLRLGRARDALEPLRRARELAPDDGEVRFLLGSALLQTGAFEEAVDELRRAVESRPDPRFHNELGAALMAVRRFPEAVEEFRAAIALAPDYIDPYNNAGAALVLAGDPAGAAEFFRRAVARRPDYVDARYNLASLLRRVGDAAGARRELEEVLRRRPDHPQARALLRRLDED